MNPQDANYVDPTSVSPQSTGIRYGLIWGLVGILLGLLAHIMGWNNPAEPNVMMSMIIWLATIGVSVAMVFMAIKHHRDQELGGAISLGRAFKVGFIAALVSALIGVVWMFIYTKFIAPEMFSGMEDMMVQQWEEQGLTEEQIEQAKGWAGMMTGPVAMIVSPLVVRLIWGSILAVIMGAVMKKDPAPLN